MVVIFEGLVGGGIERVFDMFAEAGIFEVEGVAQQDGPFALRMFRLQVTQAIVCQILPSLSRVEQEQMVPCFVQMFEVGIVVCQA